MCDPLVGCRSSLLLAPCKGATNLFSRWGHRHDFPVAQWRSLLGQTLARCVALRKQMERQVIQLRADAADYLQCGLLHRADDKDQFKQGSSDNVLASSSSIRSLHQLSYRKANKINSKQGNVPSSSRKISVGKNTVSASSSVQKSSAGKKNVSASSSEQKSPVGKNNVSTSSNMPKSSKPPKHEPSHKKLNEVKSLNPTKLEFKDSRDQIKNKKEEYAESTSGMQVGIQHASNVTLAAQAAHELSKIHVSSDVSDNDEEEDRPINSSCRPPRFVEFEEVKARLTTLKKEKQHTS